MTRGKRKSKAQRIGRKGEHIFAAWAEDRLLSANKVEADYGIDFFCQLFRRVTKVAEEATGKTLGVQVKSTEGKSRPRVIIDRKDAVDLLKQDMPTALIGVHVERGSVHFKFLGKEFIDQLNQFLASEDQTLSIQFVSMDSTGSDFDRQLAHYSRIGVQHELRLHKTQLGLEKAVKGISFSLVYTAGGALAMLQVPWLGSAFHIRPRDRDKFRTLVFEQQKPFHEIPDLALKPEVMKLLELVKGPALIEGTAGEDVEIAIEHQNLRATAGFRMCRVGDETAFTSRMGISLVFSDARRHRGKQAHELQIRLFATTDSLNQENNLAFLRLLRSGAKLSIDGEKFISLDEWGHAAVRIGPAIDAVQRLCSFLNLDLNEFHLADIKDEEFARSMAFLEAFILDNLRLPQFSSGFVIGPMSSRDPEEVASEPVLMEVPIVMNVKTHGVVLWVRAKGAAFLNEEKKWCGLRIAEQLNWSHELHARFAKSAHPEMWLFRNWPPILLDDQKPGTCRFDVKHPDYITLEADFRRLSDVS